MAESVEEFLARGGKIDVVTDHTRNKSFKEARFKISSQGVPTYRDDDVARKRQGYALRSQKKPRQP